MNMKTGLMKVVSFLACLGLVGCIPRGENVPPTGYVLEPESATSTNYLFADTEDLAETCLPAPGGKVYTWSRREVVAWVTGSTMTFYYKREGKPFRELQECVFRRPTHVPLELVHFRRTNFVEKVGLNRVSP
jgi:hypothetical protein